MLTNKPAPVKLVQSPRIESSFLFMSYVTCYLSNNRVQQQQHDKYSNYYYLLFVRVKITEEFIVCGNFTPTESLQTNFMKFTKMYIFTIKNR